MRPATRRRQLDRSSVPIHKSYDRFMADLVLRHGLTEGSRRARKLASEVVVTGRVHGFRGVMIMEGTAALWTTPA